MVERCQTFGLRELETFPEKRLQAHKAVGTWEQRHQALAHVVATAGQSSGQLRWGCLLAQAVPQNGPHTIPTRTADTPVLKVRLEELTAVVASDFAPYLQQVFPVSLPICIRASEEQQW